MAPATAPQGLLFFVGLRLAGVVRSLPPPDPNCKLGASGRGTLTLLSAAASSASAAFFFFFFGALGSRCGLRKASSAGSKSWDA